MRSLLLSAALLGAAFPLEAQEALAPPPRIGDGATGSTTDASVLSIVGWSLGFAVVVATVAILLDQSSSTNH